MLDRRTRENVNIRDGYAMVPKRRNLRSWLVDVLFPQPPVPEGWYKISSYKRDGGEVPDGGDLLTLVTVTSWSLSARLRLLLLGVSSLEVRVVTSAETNVLATHTLLRVP